MKNTNQYLSITQCTVHYGIEHHFVNELYDMGLIALEQDASEWFIEIDQLPQLEKYIRWHYDLNVNMEGIDVINNMLQQMTILQQELQLIKNELNCYKH